MSNEIYVQVKKELTRTPLLEARQASDYLVFIGDLAPLSFHLDIPCSIAFRAATRPGGSSLLSGPMHLASPASSTSNGCSVVQSIWRLRHRGLLVDGSALPTPRCIETWSCIAHVQLF
jgi:hypothetical protein